MPVTLTIDQDRRLVYSAFLGTINEKEFLGQTDRIQSHPLFDPHYADIVDFSSTTEVNVSEGAIRTMARQKSIFARDAIHIIIAPRGLISKLANMFQEITKPIRPNVVVVQTPAQAYEYLRQHSKYHSERKPSSSRVSEESKKSIQPLKIGNRVMIVGLLRELALYRAEVLRDRGFQVLTPETIEEAIAIIEQGHLDVAVLSYTLPDTSVKTIAETLREHCPDCPIVAIVQTNRLDRTIAPDAVVLADEGPPALVAALKKLLRES
jgi:CheY-like chemotaxis protein